MKCFGSGKPSINCKSSCFLLVWSFGFVLIGQHIVSARNHTDLVVFNCFSSSYACEQKCERVGCNVTIGCVASYICRCGFCNSRKHLMTRCQQKLFSVIMS